jgi:hypothetical protein
LTEIPQRFVTVNSATLVASSANLTQLRCIRTDANSAGLAGGVLFSVVSDVWLSRATFASSTASGDGGALSMILGSLMANNSELTLNHGDIGGAITAQSLSRLQFTNGSFDGSSVINGGALNVEDQRGPLHFQSCAFVHNSASSVDSAVQVGSSSVRSGP